MLAAKTRYRTHRSFVSKRKKHSSARSTSLYMRFAVYTVRDQVTLELDALVSKTNINYVYLMPSSGRLGWPASALKKKNLDSYAQFINMAWTRGVQVGLSLNTHCVVPDSAVLAAGQTPMSQSNAPFWPVCSNQNVDDATIWYKTVMTEIESRLQDTAAIAFWEMGGNPVYGAAEMPLWSCSGYSPEVESFVRQAWPQFVTFSTRPKVITFLPILEPSFSCDRYSAISNFISWTTAAPAPDYYLVSASVAMDMGTVIKRIGDSNRNKIILADLLWGDNITFNPELLSQEDVARIQFARVQDNGLAGWFFWSYRDYPKPTELKGIRDTISVGLEGGWKEAIVDIIKADTALP